MNSPPVTVIMHKFRVLWSNCFVRMHTKSNFVARVLPSSSDIFFYTLEFNSSMFGICSFRFIVISLKCRESSAILIDLSFFTVIIAGLTKQTSVILIALSKYQFCISRFITLATCSCKYIGIGRLFCCITCASFSYRP